MLAVTLAAVSFPGSQTPENYPGEDRLASSVAAKWPRIKSRVTWSRPKIRKPLVRMSTDERACFDGRYTSKWSARRLIYLEHNKINDVANTKRQNKEYWLEIGV